MKKKLNVFICTFLLLGVQSAIAADKNQENGNLINESESRSSYGVDVNGAPFPPNFPPQPAVAPFKLTQGSFKFVVNKEVAKPVGQTGVVAFANCGLGYVAIAGGGSCLNLGGGNERLEDTCPSNNGSSCIDPGTAGSTLPYSPAQGWLTRCDDGGLTDVQAISYATCVPIS